MAPTPIPKSCYAFNDIYNSFTSNLHNFSNNQTVLMTDGHRVSVFTTSVGESYF